MAVLPTGIGPVTGYNIERSLRFNSADSAYLNRTPASQPTTWTLSFWVKRGKLGAAQAILVSRKNAVGSGGIEFTSGNNLNVFNFTSNGTTSAVYRDCSSWYHFVVYWSGTSAAVVYCNGVLQTMSSNTSGSSNLFTSTWTNCIGNFGDANSAYLDGYLTEVNFIDGQALTPSSFGETDSNTGVWKPKAYTGTYGTNGFYLPFSDNASTTTLGDDFSGNGNDWTTNNFSVTAGVGNDSLVDSPTPYGTDTGVGGSVRGNYATLNPLVATDSTLTYANGNLNVSGGGSSIGTRATISTIVVTSGKWYAEVNVGTTNNGVYAGIIKPSNLGVSRDISWNYYDNLIYPSGSGFSGTAASGDIIGIAYDADNGTVQFYKNGSTIGSQQTGATVGAQYGFYVEMGSGGQVQDWNFGQRAFAYTAPSGFKALCTQNLPTPTIGATSTTLAGKYFNAITYTGDGTASRSITGVGFRPDFVWIKNRTVANFHQLHDAVRGATVGMLASNSTNAEDSAYPLTSFNTDGYTTKSGAQDGTNNSGSAIVAWNWNAGGSNATNTAGTITSTVRANTTSGFSIVTYTGNATSGATVGHGLGATPAMIIVKNRSTGTNWPVYHANLTSAAYLLTLNTTNAQATDSAAWNNTAPTSTLFTLGNSTGTNGSTNNLVAYCFAPVAGYSAFGSYTGNGSTDGPFVYLGFRPEFIMFKRTDATSNWLIIDAARSPYNQTNEVLLPNSSSAEGTGAGYGAYDFLSNGFKPRNVVANETNVSGGTYIYAAFAEFPFKFSLAR